MINLDLTQLYEKYPTENLHSDFFPDTFLMDVKNKILTEFQYELEDERMLNKIAAFLHGHIVNEYLYGRGTISKVDFLSEIQEKRSTIYFMDLYLFPFHTPIYRLTLSKTES